MIVTMSYNCKVIYNYYNFMGYYLKLSGKEFHCRCDCGLFNIYLVD